MGGWLWFLWALVELPWLPVCSCFAVGGGDFVMSLSDDRLPGVVDAFNTTSRYLDDILDVNGVCFGNVLSQIYPLGLRLGWAGASGAGAAFLDLRLSVSNDIVSAKVCDERDDFDFEIVNFPFLEGGVPRSASCGVYVSQLVRFAGASGYVAGFGTRNKLLTRRLLRQGCRCRGLRRAFSKFYGRCFGFGVLVRVGLGSLLRQKLSGPGFCGGLVCVG